MTQHTPGPWYFHDVGLYLQKEGREYTHLFLNLERGRHCNKKEWAANGRLIAAAPDMLAALQMLPIYGMPVATLDAIRDAITKATGTRWEGRVAS